MKKLAPLTLRGLFHCRLRMTHNLGKEVYGFVHTLTG
jgi:hypothetical protein